MAVRESMVNAVAHKPYSAHKKVLGSPSTAIRSGFTVRIGEKGGRFREPARFAGAGEPHAHVSGIFLIRSFMDEFEMRHLESVNRGNLWLNLAVK
jgi:hypothetical protein